MVHLKDYREPEFYIRETILFFDLHEDHARVRSKLKIERNKKQTPLNGSILQLHGEGLTLRSVKLNGTNCTPLNSDADPKQAALNQYGIFADGDSHHMLCIGVGDLANFEVEIEVTNEPHKNLACEGLYKSSGMFCTQCEAESFRKITYFADRPDVMSLFTVTIEADKTKYPILLSNGNRIASRDLGNGRHEATWQDPFNKPAYLFALVAGDLGCLKDHFVTKSGRKVALEIFGRKGHESRFAYAMQALKNSMRWDEERFGLEYDLDVFMIVVADDFNMGAMENKGLNIFNAHYILADAATATDKDFANVEAVVGHEYFHNWTGNRITCRDWFQLSLKEGLTVYRDQEFSADMGSRAVKRIEDVIRLRTHQFAEDAGPMAHAVRPQSYLAIDNFYTLTIYEKGSEVIRMIETLIGRETFRKGMDKYFELFDGQAVTTDDFVRAMEIASGRDLTQFKNWYDQAGTPKLKVQTEWKDDTYSITLEQSCGPSPGQDTKKPYHMPIAIGLLGHDGRDLIPTRVLELTEPKQKFEITGIKEKPVLSLLRGFSAPVRVEFEQSIEELAFLMAHDSDAVARWEATQTMMIKTLLARIAHSPSAGKLEESLLSALEPLLKEPFADPAFVSFMLQLPSEAYVAQFLTTVDPELVFRSRESLLKAIAKHHRQYFENIYGSLSKQDLSGINQKAMGLRALLNTSLMYLCLSDEVRDLEKALSQRRTAKDMTTELGALEALNRSSNPTRLTAIDEFKAKWKHEPLVMNKWLTIRAVAATPNSLSEVKALMDDPVYDRNNPNKIYSLLLAFAKFNSVGFHDKSGAGYRFIADQVIEIDARNPQVGSRLVSAFNQWKTFDKERQLLMKSELERIAKMPGLSSNVAEIVGRALA